MESIPLLVAWTTYFSYLLLYVFGHIRDVFRPKSDSGMRKGYPPLCKDYEDFYTRRVYKRIEDCFNRPIKSAPDSWIDVCIRTHTSQGVSEKASAQTAGETVNCLNLGSYNYLGFGCPDAYCTDKVVNALKTFGPSPCASRSDGGTISVNVELENLVAEVLNKEAAMVFGMGFATNSLTIPLLVGKGCLVLSDALNHASIVAGVRASGAKMASTDEARQVQVFKHNNATHLEAMLRKNIAEGQPKTGRAWKKILIIVEGIYSMEGEICYLREIIEVKKKYGAYIYLDEAHSIGAMGKTGRGITEHLGVDRADIDIMMGTFTKSFGSCGGYIAGSRELITYLKSVGPAHLFATAMSGPCAQQVISTFEVILGRDNSTRGQEKLTNLRENSNWFRRRLKEIGCCVLGDEDSPIMPILVYNPAKLVALSRECFKQKLAIVIVGFPATPLLSCRARICISAAHSREDLEYAINVLQQTGNALQITYNGSSSVKKGSPASPATNGYHTEEIKSD